MADDNVKPYLDEIVKAIGFGIVSDFRTLSDAVLGISSDIRDGNRILDQVNQNVKDIDRTLTDFDRSAERRREFNRNRRLEDQLERRSKLNAQRGEDSIQRIVKAIEGLQRQVSLGAAARDSSGGGDGVLEDAAEVAIGAGAAAAGGSFLKGATKLLGKAGIVGGLVAAGGAAAYLLSGSSANAEEPAQDLSLQGPSAQSPPVPAAQEIETAPTRDLQTPPQPSVVRQETPLPEATVVPTPIIPDAPTFTPAPVPEATQVAASVVEPVGGIAGSTTPPPTVAADMAKMGAAQQVGTALSAGAVSLAAQAIVNRTSTSAKQKALSKVQNKVPSWLAKNGSRVVNIIGAKSIPIFGALVGGYFSFSRFMSGDSWMSIGMEFVSGVAPDVGALGGPAGYVAGVASTLAIQAYLISRDIYQEENAIDIRNNVVPNFDDLEMSEKAQVLNAVKNYLVNYVNGLISKSNTQQDASIGITPTSTSGAAPGAAPAIGAAAAGGATAPPATPPATTDGATAAGGATTQAAQDIAETRAQNNQNVYPGGPIPQTVEEQENYTQNIFGGPTSTGAPTQQGAAGQSVQAGASPSDTIASIQTSSNQAGDIYAGGTMESLKAEIARGEGDYGAYNRGVAGDTPTSQRTMDIQNLTVGQIMDLQRQDKLFAVGKYQFIPGTFAEAVQYTGVDPNQKFDAATQERMFPYLISEAKRPTLASYLSGKHDDVDSALNDLAAEFASIPQANGRGRYDGDRAGNKAAGGIQRAQKIKQILQGIRQSNTSTPTESNTGEEVRPFAKGAEIIPLSADKPKPGRDLSAGLMPISQIDMASDEEKITSSQQTIDARKKSVPSGSPAEFKKNKIATYMPYMSHLFGTVSEEIRKHMHGEVTADESFKRAMDPLS